MMLMISIVYFTIAIPLQSLTRIRYFRIGFISLIFTIIISLLSFPSIYYNSSSLSTMNELSPDGIFSESFKFQGILESESNFSLFNDLFSATPITNTIDVLLLFIGAILLSPYLKPSKFLTYSNLFFGAQAGKDETVNNINGPSFFKEAKKNYVEGTSPTSGLEILNNQEYIIFTLCTLLGAVLLSASNDLLSLLLSIELQSYSLYIIASTSHYAPKLGTKYVAKEPSEAAGLKYYLLGALASSMILLGIAILYAVLGTTNFTTLSILLESNQNFISSIDGSFIPSLEGIQTSLLGMLFIVVGFIWKFAGAPLHNWAIDVYDAVPTWSASWLAIVPKISLLTITSQLLILFNYPFSTSSFAPWLGTSKGARDTNIFQNNHVKDEAASSALLETWPSYLHNEISGSSESFIVSEPIGKLILFVSALSMIVGAIAALTQPLIKRVLAYSSVGQLGFILLGIGVGSLESSFFYLIQYSITNTGIWLCLLVTPLLSRPALNAVNYLETTQKSPARYLSEIRSTKELQGLHENNFFIALSFALLLLSTAGVPPMIGFFGKLEIISASVNAGYFYLGIIAIVASLISATYYLIIIKAIWFSSYLKPSSFLTHSSTFSINQPSKESKGLSTNEKSSLVSNQISSNTSLAIAIITFMITLFIFQGSVILTWIRCSILML